MANIETLPPPAEATGTYWPQSCPDCCSNLDEVLLPLRKKFIELTAQVNSYRGLLNESRKREENLKEQLAQAEAKIRQLKKQAFGRKAEQGKGKPETLDKTGSTDAEKKKRGRQPGSPPPKRRRYSNLPTKEETASMTEEESRCPDCGLPAQPFFRDEESEVIEVVVQAHIRKIKRKCYTPGCKCGVLPGVMMAPVIGALFPGSNIGVWTWMEILLAKYRYGEPINRLLNRWDDMGAGLPPGTVHSNLPRMSDLFAPLARLVEARNRKAEHWHIDETSWMVFAEMPGKVGHRWWLWVFVSQDTVVFKLAPSRSADVVREHLGEHPSGIASVDRYSAYKAVAIRSLYFMLAYCWAHVRRDFLKVQLEWPETKDWAQSWLEMIAALYHANNLRRESEKGSDAFLEADKDVQQRIEEFRNGINKGLKDEHLHPAAQKVLNSMNEHWSGLTIFASHPWIPMDNNTAERTLRPEVVGRKNYWGSGSLKTAQLQADLGTIFFTLEKHGVNLRTWLWEYLSDCALSGGRPPEDLEKYLPWATTQARKERWQKPPPTEPYSDRSA
ncbi:MAG: IS66 family transposase [bacterium]